MGSERGGGRHVVLLLGPKGAGKSTLGRTLARTYGVHHVEPEALWIEHAAQRSASPGPEAWERAGFSRVAAAVGRALDEHEVVVTDTTAASDHTAAFVAALAGMASLHVIRLVATEATCRARVAARGTAGHLPVDDALLSRAYARSQAARLAAGTEVTLDVEPALPSPVFLLAGLRQALAERGVALRARTPTLRTARTVLRPWRADDRAPLAALNADPAVAAHLVAPLKPAESDALFARIEEGFATYGFGPWALEIPGAHAFAGFVGLWAVGFEARFTPAVEVVWRLVPDAWGHGYATESARAALALAFETLELPEVVSYTSVHNVRSRAVMERLGMQRDLAGDFEHPRVPAGHRLRPHVLYRLRRDAWRP